MLIKYILKSNPFKDQIKIERILYKKSKILKKIDLILHFIRFLIIVSIFVGEYILTKNGLLIVDINSYLNVFSQIMIGYIIMIPVFYIFLPKPIKEHLTKMEW